MMKVDKAEKEEFTGMEAREYAEKHRKWAGMMYGALLRDLRAFNVKGRCLEIGAGPCTLTALVAEINPETHITAVDIAADMVTVGNEYIREKKLEDRITYLVGDVQDEKAMKDLGTFDLVYSAYSLHHWDDKEKSLKNIWNTVGDGGMMYIFDLRRIWLFNILPSNHGEIKAIRSSFTPAESAAVLKKFDIQNYTVKSRFPFFLQSIIAWK